MAEVTDGVTGRGCQWDSIGADTVRAAQRWLETLNQGTQSCKFIQRNMVMRRNIGVMA